MDEILTAELFELMLREFEDAFFEVQQSFEQTIIALQNLQQVFSFKQSSQLHTDEGKILLDAFKEALTDYYFHLERLKAIYAQLSYDLKQVLEENPDLASSIAELEAVAFPLSQELAIAQSKGNLLGNLLEIFIRIFNQRKMNPIDQKEIENFLFQFQLLKRSY